MGRFQVSRAVRARAGVWLGMAAFCTGLGLAAGVAAALMAAGLGTVAYCVLLADVQPPDDGPGRRDA